MKVFVYQYWVKNTNHAVVRNALNRMSSIQEMGED